MIFLFNTKCSNTGESKEGRGLGRTAHSNEAMPESFRPLPPRPLPEPLRTQVKACTEGVVATGKNLSSIHQASFFNPISSSANEGIDQL